MKLKHLRYPLFVLPLLALATAALAQKEIGETVEATQEGIKAKTDSVYFEAVKARLKNDEPLALRLFEQFSVLRPEVSDTWYEMALLCETNKQIEKAEEYVKKAIELNPTNKYYRETHAMILTDRGDFADAAHVMADLAAMAPENPNYLIAAADYYERARNYGKALEYLDMAEIKRGPDEEILMQKEKVYLGLNNVEKAAEMVRKLTEQEPRNGNYYKLLGDLYDNNKMPGKAAEVYEQAEKIIPGDPNIQFGRAEHFLRIGDTASYITYLRKAILNKEQDAETQNDMLIEFIQSLPTDSVVRTIGLPIARSLATQHPKDPQTMELFGSFLENNNQLDSAAWAFNRSLQIKSNVDVWRKLMDVYLVKHDADSLIKNSERFMRLYPNGMDPYRYNAEGHYWKKEYDKAIKSINRAIDNQPEGDKAILAALYGLMGEIYHSNKQDDFSDKAYDKSVELNPDNAPTLNNFAYSLSERGKRLEDAERMSKKSLDLTPGEYMYLDTYGWILYKKGDYEKARVFVKRAIDVAGANNADGTLYDHLGNIYYKLNNRDKALENWKLAKEKGADDRMIDKKISEVKLYE